MHVNTADYHHPTPWHTTFADLTLPELLGRTLRFDPAAPFPVDHKVAVWGACVRTMESIKRDS